MPTSINMEAEIRMLIELQALDTEIFDKKKVLDETPEKLKGLDLLLESKTENLKAIEEELKKIDFPIDVNKIRLAEEPLNATSKGCLMAALSEMDSEEPAAEEPAKEEKKETA